MAVYIVCLTATGGVPIFTRSTEGLKPLPFPVIGSLNGVHMFGNNHGVELLSCTTDDSKVVWKIFQDTLTIIAIQEDDKSDDCHLNNLVKFIYQAIVLLCGLEEVQNLDKNVEKFKKEVKVCNHLFDRLIDNSGKTTFTQLTNSVETIATPDAIHLQNFLDAFIEAAETSYGCLLVEGKVVVATRKWWSMTANELVLLALVIDSLSECTSRDVPVFLPDSHPTVPHRLLTFQLTKGVVLAVLCGPSPTMAKLEQEVVRFWGPSYDTLKSVCHLHPRNFPSYIEIDPNILGFCLVNTEENRCLGTVTPSQETNHSLGEGLSPKQRREVLHSLYKKCIGTFLTSAVDGSTQGPSEFSHQAQEMYITTDCHKCYAMQRDSHQIFVLFNTSIPTYAMRSVTTKTLNALISEKTLQV